MDSASEGQNSPATRVIHSEKRTSSWTQFCSPEAHVSYETVQHCLSCGMVQRRS